TPARRFGRVLVVANSQSPMSLELATVYQRTRLLPAANILRLPFENPINIGPKDFHDNLLTPVRTRIEQLGAAIDFIVLMRGVPYRVGGRSTTSALTVGGLQNMRPVNGYFGREDYFEGALPYYGARLWLTTMVSAYTFDEALKLIEQSQVRYEDPRSAGTFYFCDGRGPRGSRNRQIEPALMQMQRLGFNAVHVPSHDLDNRNDVLAQFTGHVSLKLGSNRYLPGSIVDNMTSFGGYLLENNRQMSILSFIRHGACGAYGTVAEPTNYPGRWANYTIAARYASGFTLAESYYQTTQDISLGVIVGDPLTAPFGKPCALQMTGPENPVSQSEPLVVPLSIKEGVPGEGIGWAELWLDNQHCILASIAQLRKGTRCSLTVTSGDETLFAQSYTLDEPQDVRRVLLPFTTAKTENGVEIQLAGRRRNRLLIRWMPQTKEPKPARATLLLDTGEQTYERSMPLYLLPVTATCATLDLGTTPPQPGDQLTVQVADHQKIVRAVRGETIDDFVKRAAAYLSSLDLFQENGDWGIQLVKTGETDPHRMLRIVPRKPSSEATVDVQVTVEKQPDSGFAGSLKNGTVPWKLVPLTVIGEGVLSPFVPAVGMTTTLRIPTDQLVPGYHTLTAIACTPRGVHSIADYAFEIIPAQGQRASRIEIQETVLDPGQELAVILAPSKQAIANYPVLIIDGRPVCNWRPATTFGTLPVKSPLVSPGKHTVWVEWTKSQKLPSSMDVRTPITRSNAHDIWIRRPLAHGVHWQPKTIEAGKPAQITFKGDYLRENLTIVTEKGAYPLSRGGDMQWTLDMPAQDPGTYTLTLMGNAETEAFQALPEKLTVK
ncbi:MAG: TIGR03790 family protein, partial [Candidatus Pacebacteria bacterium]|nr:TIGR03790 family protein [Candidatus Paceibacterota bacterium]